jgi:serine-type D-Ala-D-Ala carboxypeptidase
VRVKDRAHFFGSLHNAAVANVPAEMATVKTVSLSDACAIAVKIHAAAPGAAVAASVGRLTGEGFAGSLSYGSEASVDEHTLYDLASVTKPMVALLAARLAELGTLSFDEPLCAFLPSLSDTPSAWVPLERFLSHRAGLEAHIEIFAPLRLGGHVNRDEAIRIAGSSRRAECVGAPPNEGFAPVYSDMGYLLVGEAIAARANASLDALLSRLIFDPLEARIGSARQLASREPFMERVAPTEVVAFRGGLVRGQVHDENAFAIVGDATAGHAGLFGDARSVWRVGCEILRALQGESALWKRETIDHLVRERPGGSLRAGFDGRTGDNPSSGRLLGAKTFGHLGFTGTSLWIDPEKDFVGVLLTNRVHPTRDNIAIRAARPAVYDAMVTALSSHR